MMYESDETLQTEDQNSLEHYGIKGQKWGLRRFQNPDGSYTELGKERRRVGFKEESKKEDDKSESKAEQLPDIKIGGKAYKDMTKKELRAARKRARHNEAERRAQREFNRDKREAIENGDISFISKNISKFTNQEIDDAVNRYKKMQNVWAMDKANKKDADYYLDKTIHYLSKAKQVSDSISSIVNNFHNTGQKAAEKRKAGYMADQEYYKSLQEEWKATHPDSGNKNDGGKKDKNNKDSGTQKGVENEKKALQDMKDKSKKKNYDVNNLLSDEEKLEIHEKEQEKHQKKLDKIARKQAKRDAKLREKEEREAEKERQRQYEEDLDKREAEAKEYKAYKERQEREEREAEEVAKRNREQQEREYKEYKERQEREEREAEELQKRLKREEQERKEREEREAEARERRLQEEAHRREEEDRKKKQEDLDLRKWVDSSPEYQKEYHKEAEKALQDNWWDLMYSGKKKESLLGSFFSKKDKDKYKDYKNSDQYKKLEEDLKELNSKYLTNLSTAYSNQKVGSSGGSRRANKYNKYPSNNVTPKHIHSVQDEKWSKQMKNGKAHTNINDWIKDMTKKYQIERGMSKATAKEYAERYVDAWLEAYDEGKI